MPKIIMLQGLPASSKTTKAKQILKEDGNAIRINKDDLRAMLHLGRSWLGKQEKVTVKIHTAIIKSALAQNKNVIIDDTNLNPKHITRFEQIAKEGNHKFEIIKLDTPLEECIERDSNRDRTVGADVITNMAFQYKLVEQKGSWVWCDLDGTLADISERRKLSLMSNGKIHWGIFFRPENIRLDTPRIDIFHKIQDDINNGHEIIICSGRSEIRRKETIEWLRKYGGEIINNSQFWNRLIMRPAGNYIPDDILKLQYLDNYLDVTKLIHAYDDRPRVIRALESREIKVIDCGDGEEF